MEFTIGKYSPKKENVDDKSHLKSKNLNITVQEYIIIQRIPVKTVTWIDNREQPEICSIPNTKFCWTTLNYFDPCRCNKSIPIQICGFFSLYFPVFWSPDAHIFYNWWIIKIHTQVQLHLLQPNNNKYRRNRSLGEVFSSNKSFEAFRYASDLTFLQPITAQKCYLAKQVQVPLYWVLSSRTENFETITWIAKSSGGWRSDLTELQIMWAIENSFSTTINFNMIKDAKQRQCHI